MKKALLAITMFAASNSFAADVKVSAAPPQEYNMLTIERTEKVSISAFSGHCDGVNIEIQSPNAPQGATAICLNDFEVDILISGLESAKKEVVKLRAERDKFAGFKEVEEVDQAEINFDLETAFNNEEASGDTSYLKTAIQSVSAGVVEKTKSLFEGAYNSYNSFFQSKNAE